MMVRSLLTGGLAALMLASALPVTAAESESQFQSMQPMYTRALGEVERAFQRRQSVVNTLGQRLAAPSSLGELQAYGFFTSNPNVVTTVTQLDAERSRVCMQMQVNSKLQYHAAAQVLMIPGVVRADASCNALTTQTKVTWPGVLHVIKVLHTQDVMVRTLMPAGIPISGLKTTSPTAPALTLYAPQGQWGQAVLFSVTNPAIPSLAGQPPAPTLDIVQASVREGFQVEHNCLAIAAQTTCSVGVRYQGTAEKFRVGSLTLQFSNGKVAVISLLGIRLKAGEAAPVTSAPITSAPVNSAPATSTPVYTEPTAPATGGTVVPVPAPAPTPTLPLCNDKYKKPWEYCIPPGQAK